MVFVDNLVVAVVGEPRCRRFRGLRSEPPVSFYGQAALANEWTIVDASYNPEGGRSVFRVPVPAAEPSKPQQRRPAPLREVDRCHEA